MKKPKLRVTNAGVQGFFSRAREHARTLDRGEELAAQKTVSFENVNDMIRVLSPERVRILRAAREGAKPVSSVASGLKRDTRAVSRDIDLLEQFGLLHTRYEANPGHGKRRMVEALAAEYELVATV
jgi:predicted transcriptional regulator